LLCSMLVVLENFRTQGSDVLIVRIGNHCLVADDSATRSRFGGPMRWRICSLPDGRTDPMASLEIQKTSPCGHRGREGRR
jgi:hypothetical protein